MKDIMNSTTAGVPIPLGQTLITVRAKQALHSQEVLSALWRHAHEPWGECFNAGDAENATRLREDQRLISNHVSSRGQAFRIATERESETIVFLRDETDLSQAGLVEDWVCNLGCPNCGG